MRCEPVTLRAYARADLRAIAELFTASVHQLTASRYTLAQRQAWAPTPPDLKQWRVRLRCLRTLVAEVGAQVAGFLSYQSEGYIDLLYVRPGFERSGIASRLYDAVEQMLIHSGVTRVHTEASLIAQPFFQRRGFRATRFEEITVRSTILQRWVMYKSFEGA